jgi:hypothetical protein
MKRIILFSLCFFSINANLKAQQLTDIFIKDSFSKEMHFKNHDTITSSDQKIFKLCQRWCLNKKDILKIFKLATKISSEEKGSDYYDLPCYYKARVILNNNVYTMEINAASYIVLYNDNSQLYFGCASPKCDKYFVLKGGHASE